jgi:diguanylate cyclase (GGDEF)-like protein
VTGPQFLHDDEVPRGEALLDRILQTRTLPSPPAVALRLIQLAPDPAVDDEALADVLELDPALSARVLRMANSAFFGLPAEVRTLDRALPVLGRGAVTSLALSFSLTDESMRAGPLSEHFRRFWLRCAVQASAAETLARFRVRLPAPELFISGLLLDLGQLALLKVVGPDYARILDQVQAAESIPSSQAPPGEARDLLSSLEQETLGLRHAEIGARILEAWGIPASICQVVRKHHDPIPAHPAMAGGFDMLSAMRVASGVADCFLRVSPTRSLTSLSAHLQDHLKLPDEEVIRFLLETDERVKEAASVLSAETSGRMTAEELMAEAADHWSMMALQREAEDQRKAAARSSGRTPVELSILRRENDELRRQVFLDPLTRLYNRRFIDEMLEPEARRVVEAAETVGFLFLDIDHFKQINDSLGHARGDQILVDVARRLQGVLRSRDLVARYGGEEFVVLARNATTCGLVALADRLRAVIEETPFEVEGRSLRVTVSLGGAAAHPVPGSPPDMEAVLLLADQAMYASKNRGRNRVTIRGHDGTVVTGPNELVAASRLAAGEVPGGPTPPAREELEGGRTKAPDGYRARIRQWLRIPGAR